MAKVVYHSTSWKIFLLHSGYTKRRHLRDVTMLYYFQTSQLRWAYVRQYKLEQEFREKYVAISSAEVIKKYLRNFTRVFEETENSDEHLDELDWWQLLYSLHVLNAQCYTTLTYTDHTHTHTHTQNVQRNKKPALWPNLINQSITITTTSLILLPHSRLPFTKIQCMWLSLGRAQNLTKLAQFCF